MNTTTNSLSSNTLSIMEEPLMSAAMAMRPSRERTTLQITGMTCEHCKHRAHKALTALNGVEHVDVDLKTGIVTVEHMLHQPTTDTLRATMEELGFKVVKA